MDYASATPLDPAVVRAMTRALKVNGNPSAPHDEGRAARQLVDDARGRLGKTLSVRPETLYFTGSGTESNNLAIVGFVEALVAHLPAQAGGATYSSLHLITSAFEHPSVLEPIEFLKSKGVMVSYIAPNKEGIVSVDDVLKEVRPETVLISLATVQSEIGQVQPLKDLSRALAKVRRRREQTSQHLTPECALPILHTDASQGSLFLDVRPERLGADLVTYDAQKVRGPKGVGLLYKHSSVPLAPVIRGGSQERKLRAGTENVVGIVGMARAFERAEEGRSQRVTKVEEVRDYFIELLKKEMPDVVINGGMKHRIANNIHVSVPGADGDYLAVLMDKEGVAVSPRSACIASGTHSTAVLALGASEDQALGTLRFTFAPDVTRADARRAVAALKRARTIYAI